MVSKYMGGEFYFQFSNHLVGGRSTKCGGRVGTRRRVGFGGSRTWVRIIKVEREDK